MQDIQIASMQATIATLKENIKEYEADTNSIWHNQDTIQQSIKADTDKIAVLQGYIDGLKAKQKQETATSDTALKLSNSELQRKKENDAATLASDTKTRAAMGKNIATWQKTNEAALATQEADQARTDIKLISLDAEKYQQSISFQQSELNALIISNQAKGQSYKEYSDQV